MKFRSRNGLFGLLILFLIAATAWAFSFPNVPPADFTFVNETEIKSVDPAMVIGQPEMRVIIGLFEGLVNWDPKTLAPIPGVAEKWEISADQLTYTFHFRNDAKWTDGIAGYGARFSLAMAPGARSAHGQRIFVPALVPGECRAILRARYQTRRSRGNRTARTCRQCTAVCPRKSAARETGGGAKRRQTRKAKAPPIYEVEIDGQRRSFQMVLARDLTKLDAAG